MTVRNLEHLFRPRSIALIGASKRPDSVGSVLAANLLRAGFDGPIMPVHPKHDHIQSVTAYPDVASLPMAPDLGVIATPPDTVPALVDDLAKRGAKAAIVITAGFGEGGREQGRELCQQMLNAARPHLLRIVGPNCLGVMVPGVNLNASFAGRSPLKGRLAFVAQSGAVVTSILEWASSRGIGFSHLVSLGDMADVDFGDMLDYLANDRETRAILLYIEAVTHARKFMSAARAASRMKPVIVVKAGRYAAGARAAASHTGAIAGSDLVYDTAIRRAGMLRVFSLEELFDAVETLNTGLVPKNDRIAIVTNGGGIGVLAADAVIEEGARLADLGDETIKKLDSVLPPTWSRANPVDLIGDATAKRYSDALQVVCADRNVDALLVLNCPTAIASQADAASAVAETLKDRRDVSVLTSWLGGDDAERARRIFSESRIPTYDTPAQAVRAFMHLVNYRRNQEMLTETPPSIPQEFTPDRDAAKAVIDMVIAEKRAWLNEVEAKQVLAAYQIPVPTIKTAADPDDAARIAAELATAVVLKILSPDILHKSDVGGVALDLVGPRAVHEAAEHMHERIREQAPDAHIQGFTVQPMVGRPGAYELLLGVTEDAQFGPLLLFGQGGTAVEVIGDTASALPPLNMHLAREAISRTRIHKLLGGYRDRPAANMEAISLALIKVSQLVIDFPEIREMDVNPLLADEYGVVALDARMRVEATTQAPEQRLSIRPYPKELEEEIHLGDGRTLLLRPVVPEDEPQLQAGFAKLTAEEIFLRFLAPIKTLSHVQAARFTQIDYDREMALVLTEPGIPGTKDIFGVVRISTDPDNEKAEYAILVRHDMTGLGLGIFMMRRIINYARQRGIAEIFGDVLRKNTTMLKLCQAMGFEQTQVPDEPSLLRVTLKL